MFVLILSIIILFFSFVLIMVIVVSMIQLLMGGAPYVPTPYSIVQRMVIAAELQGNEEIVDLGSGDGRILLACLDYHDVRATGIEANPFLVLLGKFRLWIRGKNGRILWKDMFAQDYSHADVIFCYLFPGLMKKLQGKFEKELKKGAKVISYCFPLPGWKPLKRLQTQEKRPDHFLIYVYQRS